MHKILIVVVMNDTSDTPRIYHVGQNKGMA